MLFEYQIKFSPVFRLLCISTSWSKHFFLLYLVSIPSRVSMSLDAANEPIPCKSRWLRLSFIRAPFGILSRSSLSEIWTRVLSSWTVHSRIAAFLRRISARLKGGMSPIRLMHCGVGSLGDFSNWRKQKNILDNNNLLLQVRVDQLVAHRLAVIEIQV